MTIIRIEKLDEVHIRFLTDASVEAELVDFFTYEYPGARFTPKYRARLWDGKVRLADPIRKTLPAGLVGYIETFAANRGYEVEYTNVVSEYQGITYEQAEEFLRSLNLPKKIEIRDYQIDAIRTALDQNRVFLISPTGSGKSLIVYAIMRWRIEQGLRCLIVVPTTSLVEQLYADFADYSTENGFDVNTHCQKLYSGFTKEFTRNVLITTWQSVYLQPKAWFKQFNCIFGDEAHQFKAASLNTIMGKLDQVKYRVGTTGTIDNKKIHQLVLEGMFSPVHRVTTTKALMDSGRLAPLNINAIILKHPAESCQKMNKAKYQDEMEFIILNEARNKFIRNLALKCTGNTLVLFQFVKKHGDVLHEMIKSKAAEGRKVFYVHGGTDTADREQIRHIMAIETDAIVIASYGTFSTGINIPSIRNVIFSSPFKAKIRGLQSIGRGLRTDAGKDGCTLYDISDDLHWKSWKNHTLKHAAERYKTYSEEEFKIKLIEVTL